MFASLQKMDPLDPADPKGLIPGAMPVEPIAGELEEAVVDGWIRDELEGRSPSFDIPMSNDPRVAYWIKQLEGRGRGWFQRWLARIPRYAPIFIPILERKGVPKDLLFLAMIESGLSPGAYSFANAAGYWQFIPPTARRFGLEVGVWVDERRDFERSSEAAAIYLAQLHRMFGDWHLAWAAYNAGEGRVSRAIRATNKKSFWSLSRTHHLRSETKQYVPKLIAAAMIAKQPKKYGFDFIRYQKPLDWDVITVRAATDFATIAKACGDAGLEESLAALNPALYRKITPPGVDHLLRVPAGRGTQCSLGLESLPPEGRTTYRYHSLTPRDRIHELAERYRTTAEAILQFNHLEKEALLVAYDGLVIPIPYAFDSEIPVEEPIQDFRGPPPVTPNTKLVRVHRVRRGESMWSIARRYGVSLRTLRRWNPTKARRGLRVNDALKILPH